MHEIMGVLSKSWYKDAIIKRVYLNEAIMVESFERIINLTNVRYNRRLYWAIL